MLLRDYQSALFHAIAHKTLPEELLTQINHQGLAPEARLTVYQESAQLGLLTTLSKTYPVVERLVGIECFYAMASRFCQQYQPKTSDLNQYGAEFSDYISNITELKELPFLKEVAQLEWLVQEVLLEKEPEKINFKALQQVSEAEQSKLRFQLSCTVRLMEANYPVSDIWKYHQPNITNFPGIDMMPSSYFILINRRQNQVFFKELDVATFKIFQAIDNKMTIFEMLCSLKNQGFSDKILMRLFQQILVGGFLSSFSS